MEVVVARNKYWLFYFVLLVLEGVLCNTFYGKLVLKISVASKKNSVFAHRPTIFATRRSTYLKKDGDVFQIHIPGIARNSTADTISFESVRFPGYFLRHKKVEVDYRFRIAKPTVDDKYFNSEATFRIQRHSGIEGSGMLRLFEDPSYYLCVRKYNYADSALKAMKNDNTEDFRARCSFFIQKMKPENVNDAVKKSTQNDKNKQKLQISKQTNIKNVVRPFVASNMPPEIVGARKGQVSSKTGSNQRVSLTAGARVIPKTQVLPQYSGPARKAQASDKTQVASQVTSHREKGEPSEKVVRKMLDDYVKKIQTIPEYVSSQTVESNQPQQFVSNVIPQNLNPTTTMGSWNGKNKLNGQNVNFYPQTEQFDLAKSMYPQSNQGYQSQNLVYPGTSMLSYFPVVSKYDPTKQYIRTFFQEDDEHLPNPETNHPVEVGTESFQTDIKSDLKNKIHKSSTSTNTETSLGKEHTKYFKATPILSSSKVHAQNQRKLNRKTVVKETLHSKRRQQNATLIMKSKVKNVSTTMHSHQPVYSAAFRKQTTRHGAWRNKNGLSHRTADSRFKVKPASLLRLGPNKPINLHDFGKTTHREPSLNLDGLVAGVKLPLTRSNITVSSMDKDDTLDSNTITGGKNKTIHNWLKQTNSNTSLHEIQASNGNVSSQSKVAMINENQNSNGYKTNKMAASNNKEVLGFRKIEKEVNLLDSMDSKKGKIETALNKNSPIPLKNTTQLDTMRSVLENPSPDNTGTQIKKAEKQAPAAKKEHFVDETLKNFTTDASDLDLKIFGDEKNDSFAASEDKPIEAVNTTTSGENTNVDNSTSMSAFPDVKANSSDPIEKILYSAMTDDPTLKNINLTQPEDGGFTFGENKETKQNPEKHAKNDTTRMTVFDTANASTPAPERFLPPVTQTSLTKNNKTKNSTVPNDTKTATVNKTVATESGKLPEASNVTLGLANKTSVLAGNATSLTDKVPLVAEKVMKDNTSVANSTLLTQRNITLSVLKAHQNSTNLDNVTSVNDSISTVSLVNKSKDHQESTPTRTSIKEVKVMNNEETENEENSNAAMEQTSDTGDDNIPFEETTSNDVSNSDGTTEAGDNMDSATDNNEGSLATLLNQHNDGGIEYDNMDKATTFKDLGSSEMKGIAKAMSSLNIQDVDHLRSRMKTIDMIDRNPPNHFQHLKKAENDYANEGLHTNGIALGEQPDTAHVQSYTAEDKDVGDSPSAVHEENYADVLGGQTTNQQSPTVVNDNNMQLNGDAHETESTLQDPALQEASSVPVSISATAPEASTSAQESISTAQQMSTPTAQELSSAQESSMLQNEAQQSIDPSQTGGNALHVGGSNTDNMVSAGNNMVAQRDENAEGTGLNLGSQGGEASGVTMGTENELSSFTPQKQAEQGDNVGEMDNVNEQGSVVPQQDVNADSPDARSNLNKKHHRHPHPQKAVVVKGVAKNTVLKVPIAISYSKVHEEDNSGHHKLEHMIKDVIHDVKNELHGGGGDINEQQQGMFRHATLASNDILPHFSHVEEEHGPVVGSPRVEHHPVTLYETEHYEPAKSSSGIVTPESFQERPMMQHEVNVVRHTHHVVTVKDDSEKQKMVNGLVDYDSDRCVSLQLINDLPSRYRLISSINKHGYTPRGKVFTLKTVFKDPSAHKYVSFHAIDESEPSKQVTLDGAKELISVPTPCQSKPKVVHVAGVQTKPSIVSKKDILPDVIPEVGTDETHVEKKNRIAYPLQEHFIVHNLNGLHKRQHITHIYLKKAKKDRISYPRQMRRFNVMRDSVTSPCIRTYGGSTHSSVECCHLPYIYNGRVHSTCLSDGPNSQPWCSLTRDFDQDKRWGLCMNVDTFFGKLVLKMSPYSTRSSLYSDRPFVFATRRSTYLKKHGDVFKIHTPGLARGAGRDSISFESVRWPGYYLKHRAEENDFKFRIARSKPSNYRIFNKEATFVVEKHNGIEGSGMLRLFDKPSWYLCVRKHDIADSALKAMKRDSSPDFRLRCSFFIEKLEPAAVVGEVMKTKENHHDEPATKRKHIHRPALAIRKLLDSYVNHGKLELLRDDLGKSFGQTLNTIADNKPQQMHLVNNYLQPSRISALEATRTYGPSVIWSKQSPNNALRSFNSHLHVLGSIPHPSTIKTPIAQLSDKIAQLSFVPRLDSYTFTKAVSGNEYSLYKGRNAFPAARFSRTQQSFNRPAKWHDVKGKSIKKNEISKAYNNTNNTTKTENVSGNNIRLNETKVSILGNLTKENSSVVAFGGNETREIHSDKVVNQNSTRFYHILHGVSNGVVRVKIESSISDSKKVENLMENPNLLSLHSSGTNLNLSNSTLFNNDPKYVRKKTISHGFYQEEPLMEGLIADPKKPEVAFDDDESKGMEVKHLFADSKGHVSPLNINEPNKNPTVHIESSKNVADSEVNKDGDLSANDGNKMGAIHVNEGSKEAALTLSEASKEASINFNGVSKDAGLTIGESSKEPDLKQEGTVVSHVFADSKGHVIPMNRNQDQKSTGAKTNEKQITGEAKETFESAPATGNVNAETKSVNVKHLFANNTGRIEGLKPRHNSYIAKLTSPLTSLKELKKLGKKIKLGAHCKRSVGGAIHVSECDDEDSNTHENEMTDTDIPGHSHFTDHDNSEAGLTDLDLSHFDHKSNAEEDPVDSITTEAADGDKESETDEVYGHKSGSEVDDEHEEGANEDEDEEENEHQSHHGNHHDYDENHHDDAYHHGDHEHEHHHEGDDHDYNDHHNHEHSYHEHDNGEHHFEENHHGDHGEHHYTRHDMGHETEHEGHEEHEDHGEHEEHEDHEDHGEHEGLGEHEDHEEHEDHGEHEENDDHGEHHEDHGDHHDDDSYDDGHMEPGHHWIDQNGEHHVYMGDSWESKSCREGKCSSSSGGSTGGSGGKSNSSTSGGSSSSSSSGGSSNSSTASSEGSSGSSSSAGSGGSTGSSGSTGSGSSSSSGGSTGSTGSTESGGTSGSSGSTGSGGSSGTSSSGGTSGSNSSAGSTSSAGNSMGGVNIGTSVGSGGGTAGAGSAGGITIGGGAGGSSGPTGGIKIDGNGSTGREGSAGGIKVNGGSTAAGGAGGSTGLKIGTDSNESGGTTGGTKGAGVKIGGGTSGSGNVSPINNQTGGSASSSKGKAINANSTGADSAASAGVDNKNLPQLLNAKLPLGNANIGGGSKNNSANKNAGANNNNAGGLNNIGTNNNKATANNNGGAVNNSGNNNGGLNNGGLNNSENNNGRLNNGRLNNGAANGGTNAGAGNGLTDPNSLNNIFNTNNNLNQNNNNNSSSGGGGGGGATNNNNNITANKSNNANNNANTGNQNNNPFGGGSNNNSNAGGGGFPNTLGGGGGGGLPNPLGINIADAVKQLPNLLGNGLPNLGGIPNPLGGGGGGGLPNPLGGGGGPFGFNKTKGGKKIENGKANNNFNNNKTSSGSIVNNENMKGGAKNNEKTGVKNVENVSKNNKDLKTAHKNAEDTKIDGKNAGETQMNGKKEDDIKVGEKSKENVKLKDESESKVKYVDEHAPKTDINVGNHTKIIREQSNDKLASHIKEDEVKQLAKTKKEDGGNDKPQVVKTVMHTLAGNNDTESKHKIPPTLNATFVQPPIKPNLHSLNSLSIKATNVSKVGKKSSPTDLIKHVTKLMKKTTGFLNESEAGEEKFEPHKSILGFKTEKWDENELEVERNAKGTLLDKNFSIPRRKENAEYVDDESTKNADPKKSNKYVMKLQKYKHEKELKEKKNQTNFIVNKNLNVKNKTVLIRNHMQTKLFLPQLVKNNRTQNKENDSGKITTNQAVELSTDLTEKKKSVSDGEKRISTPDDFLLDDKGNVSAKLSTKERDELRELFNFTSMNKTNTNKSETKLAGTVLSGMQDSNETNKTFEETETEEEKDFVENAIENNIGNQTLLKEELKDLDKDFGFEGSSSDDEGSALNSEEGSGNSIKEIKIKDSNHLKTNKTKVIQKADEASMLQKIKASGKGKPKTASGEVILHPTTQRHVTNPNAKKDPFKTESVNDIYLYRNKSHNPAEEGLNVNKTNKAKNNQQKQQQQAFVNSFSDSFQEILKQAERKVERDNAAEGSEGKLKVKKQKADEKLEDEDVFGNKKISADEQREVRKKSNRNQTKPVIKDAPKPLTYNSSKIDISNAKPAKEERNASSTMLGSKNTTAKSRKQLAKKLTGEILTHLSKAPQESAKQVIQLKVTKKPNATGKNKKVAEDKKLTSEDSSLKENEKQNTVERKKLKKKKENAKLKKEKSSAALSESALENKIKSTAVFNDSVLQSEYKENSNNDSFTNVQAASVESSKIQYGANKTTSMFQSNQSFNETLQSNANTTNKTTSNQLTNAVRNVTSKTQPNSMTDNTVQYNGMTASDAEKVNRITPNDALNADLNTPSQYSKESSLSDTALLNKSSQYQSFTDDKAGDGLKYGQNSKVDKKEKGMTYGNQELGKTIFATDIPEARTSEDETPTGSTKVSKMEFYKTGSSISKMNSKQKLQTNNLTVKSNTTKLAKGQHQNKTKVHNVARQPLNDDAENIDSSSLEELDNFEDMDSFSGFAENDTNALNNEFSNEDSKALHDYLLSSNKGPLKIKGLPQQTLNALANDLKETASMTNEVSFKKLPSVKNATLNSARHRNTTVRKENTKSEKPTLNATLTMLKSKDSELIKETTKDTQQSSSGDGSDFLDHSSDEQYKTHNTAFGESTKVNDATSMDSTSPRKETGAIKGEKEVLSSLNNNLDAAQSSLNTGKNVNPSTINYHNKNKTQTLKPKLDFENEDQDQADKVKVLIKQTNPREKPLKELTQWLSDVIKTSSSRGENMNKTTFLVNNVANRSNLVNDYKRINKTQSVAKPAKKPIESDEHVKEVLVNAAHEGKDAQSNSYGKKPNEESIEVNKMKEQRLTSVNEMHHTKIADDIKGDKQIAGGDTINGLAKAMAEIMSSNPDNGNSMEDLENIDSTAKNILSEVDEDSKGDDLTDEDNSNATDEASKGKFSPNMTTHNSTQAHLKDKTSAKGIPSTAESYFVSQNVDEDDEEGDNSKSSNADPKAAAAPLKVSPKTKLKLKVPLSYTRPSLGNVKATEQETVKGQNVEVHVNGKAGSTVAAFAKEKNAESKGELIHEFKQLFNIGDSGETKKAPKVSKVNHIDSSKPTANVWDKIKQKAVAGARQIGAKKVHEHRIVTVKDEAEKERMVNGLVADIDRCVSLKFTNELGNRYKLVSSINNHGYTPRGKIFTLKQVFKDPRAHRYVSFHASDELDEDRAVLLNGARELVAVPVSCKFKPRVIKVTSRKQAKRANLFKKDNVSPLAMRNIGYMGFEQENEQGFCSSRCTEYCATSCPSYCCSAPIPGGERAPGETSDENTPREEDNAAQNEPSSRDDLPSAADNDDKDDTRADDIDDDRDDDANDDRADDNSEDRNDERNDSREESDQLLPNSRQAVQQDDSDQSSPW